MPQVTYAPHVICYLTRSLYLIVYVKIINISTNHTNTYRNYFTANIILYIGNTGTHVSAFVITLASIPLQSLLPLKIRKPIIMSQIIVRELRLLATAKPLY